MTNPIRVILADDHQMLREGFKTMMRRQEEINIVAEADNGLSLLEVLAQHPADVVITDIKMPGMDGVSACRQIREKFPHVAVIALSTFDNDHLVVDMLDAGAKGYLLKNTDKEEVTRAVKSVHEGGTYFCDAISSGLQKIIAQTRHTPYRMRELVEFTQRELDIIRLSCQQFTNKEIGSVLNLSTRTIEAHKDRMQSKIDAKNMVGVIIYAIRNGLIQIDGD